MANIITAVAILIIAIVQVLQWLESHNYRKTHQGRVIIGQVPKSI